VRYFTQKFARRMNKGIDTIPSATMSALAAYHWPGNIRELENFIERAVILSRGSTLEAPLGELRAPAIEPLSQPAAASSPALRPSHNGGTLEDVERETILSALQDSRWVLGGKDGAAARLGMKRTTLQSKIARLGIRRQDSPTR